MTRLNEERNGDRREDYDADLLPWLVADRLDDKDRDRLLARIRTDDGFAKEAAGAEIEAFAAISDNEAMGAPSPAVFDRLMADIEREKQPQSAFRISRLGGLLRGWSDRLREPALARMAGAAAAILLLVQAGVIAMLLSGDVRPGSRTYETASGEGTIAETHLVKFADNATFAEISAILSQVGARIEGPLPGGFSRIVVEKPAEAGEPSVTERLKQAKLVMVILPGG
jgi:hypothetical protein